MCTIVVLHRAHPDHPLVVAANRDELLAREALPPRVLSASPPVVGGVDCEHGGTWLGVTPRGLFVGITNQRRWSDFAPAPRSRGHLALAALEQGTPAAVRSLLESTDPSDYNSFNLIWGDASSVHVAYGRRGEPRVRIVDLPEGIHVLANDRLGSPEFPKTARAAQLVTPFAGAGWPTLEPALRALLADHRTPPMEAVPEPPAGSPVSRELAQALQAICIHTPIYGTRSATILAIDEGAVAHYRFADGPPCVTELVDVTSLLSRL